MSTREYHSASACYYNAAYVEALPDQEWVVSAKPVSEEHSLPCVIMEPESVVRIPPMARKGGWQDVHFHPHLRLPMECSVGNGMLVTLEAKAKECVAVALSPDSSFQLGKTYVVHFGASGNLSTVLRRRLLSGIEAVDISIPSRVCDERSWVSYWICLVNTGKLYVGTSKLVGQSCIGVLDDGLYHQLRSGVDAVRFVGLGNSALGRHARPVQVRNVCVTTVPAYLTEGLAALPQDLPLVSVLHASSSSSSKADQDATATSHQDAEMQALMEEYQKECQKNKARAKKFGIPYKEPSPQAFLQWSQARRLRANPEKGFITGMDITTPDELAKQEARKARFGLTSGSKREAPDVEEKEDDNENSMEKDKEPLVVTQAWDNEALIRQHRKDPPADLWTHALPPEERRQDTDEYAMEPSEPAVLVPEKVHICSTDWAAFKQIRTDDVMAYFKDYGPSYIEWLGELSCNVLFEDKFSAARALQHMSQEIPSPPPTEVAILGNSENASEETASPPDLGNMGWRFCLQPIRKVANDRYGRRGTTARVLMRVATSEDILVERPSSWPAPPPGFSTNRVLGPGSDFDTKPRKKKRRRGAKSSSDQSNSRSADTHDDLSKPGREPQALDRGLRAGREGFSVQDLEAERARKREVVEGSTDGDVAAIPINPAETIEETNA